MNKTTRNYWLDMLMGILALIVAVSSFLLWVVFPRGYYPARTLWVAIHKWVGLALGVAVLVHVVLHWRWLTRVTRRYLARALPSRNPSKAAERAADGPLDPSGERGVVSYKRHPGHDSMEVG